MAKKKPKIGSAYPPGGPGSRGRELSYQDEGRNYENRNNPNCTYGACRTGEISVDDAANLIYDTYTPPEDDDPRAGYVQEENQKYVSEKNMLGRPEEPRRDRQLRMLEGRLRQNYDGKLDQAHADRINELHDQHRQEDPETVNRIADEHWPSVRNREIGDHKSMNHTEQIEPYGAQMLRQLHQEDSEGLAYWHEALNLCDHPKVRKLVEDKLSRKADRLDKYEQAFKEHYGHLPPLSGMDEGSEDAGVESGDTPEEDTPVHIDINSHDDEVVPTGEMQQKSLPARYKSFPIHVVRGRKGWYPAIAGFVDPQSKAYPSKDLATKAALSFASRFKALTEGEEEEVQEDKEEETEDTEDAPREGDEEGKDRGEPGDMDGDGVPDEEDPDPTDPDVPGDQEQGEGDPDDPELNGAEQAPVNETVEYLKNIAMAEANYTQELQQQGGSLSKALHDVAHGKVMPDEPEESTFHKTLNEALNGLKALTAPTLPPREPRGRRKALLEVSAFCKELSGRTILSKDLKDAAGRYAKMLSDMYPTAKDSESNLDPKADPAVAIEEEKDEAGMKALPEVQHLTKSIDARDKKLEALASNLSALQTALIG